MKPPGARVSAVWPAAVALLAAAVYTNTLSHGFTLDDVDLVERNPHIASLRSVPTLFARPYWPDAEGASAGLYRPVTLASLALNRALFGPGPAGFHAVNVALHAAACVLAWFALRRAGVHYGTALLGATIFAVHPIHTEAVAGIVGRAEMLAAIGALGAWIAHRRSREAAEANKRVAWAVAAAVLYLAAVLSKEGAVLAPLLYLADDALRAREDRGRRSPARALPYAIYALSLVVALTLRHAALGGVWGTADVTPLDNPAAFAGTLPRIATAAWVQARFAALTLWPASLSSDYSHAAIPLVETLGDPRAWAGLSVAAAAVALAVHGARRSRPVALAVATWVLFFLPSSNLVFPSGTIMAERLAYLPSLGACLLAGHLGAWLARDGVASRGRRALAVVAAAAVVLAALGARTWTRNRVWKDNETLALHDVEVMPRSAKLHAGAAIALARRGDDDRAVHHFREALSIYPDYSQMHYNLATVLARQGRTDEALDHAMTASSLSPNNPRPYKLTAGWLETAGRTDEALAAYERGSTLDPADHAFRFNHGRALMSAGRTEEADLVLSRLITDAPDTFPARVAAALRAELRGDVEEAATLYRTLLADPSLPPTLRPNLEHSLASLPTTEN